MNNFKNLSKKEKAEYIAIIALYPLIWLFAQLGKVCSLFSTKKRQITASVLSAAMMVAMLPALSLTAFAAPNNNLEFRFEKKFSSRESRLMLFFMWITIPVLQQRFLILRLTPV